MVVVLTSDFRLRPFLSDVKVGIGVVSSNEVLVPLGEDASDCEATSSTKALSPLGLGNSVG